MNFLNLAEQLLDPSQSSFKLSDWPAELQLPSDSKSGLFGGKNIFWEHIKKIREYTDVSVKKFSDKHEGSTGWEYAFIMGFVDNKFYYSAPHTSKDYTEVQSKHSLSIKSEVNAKQETVIDTIIIDDQEVGQLLTKGPKEIKLRAKKIQEHSFKLGFICNFHSHPLIQVKGLDRKIYTFFSRTDITSLLTSNMHITGLVTDRLWLLAKTDESTLPEHAELKEVTEAEAYHPNELIRVASDTVHRHGFALYVAEFGGKLKRV